MKSTDISSVPGRRHERAADPRHLRRATGHAPEIGVRVDSWPENERAGWKRECTRPSPSMHARSDDHPAVAQPAQQRASAARAARSDARARSARAPRSTCSSRSWCGSTTGSFSSSNSTVPSCLDELMLNVWPASASICALQLGLDHREATSARSSSAASTMSPVQLHAHAASRTARGTRRAARGRRAATSACQIAADASARCARELGGALDRERASTPCAARPTPRTVVLVGQRATEHVLRDERQIVRRPVARLREVRGARGVADDAREREPGGAARRRRHEIVAELRRARVLEPRRERGPRRARRRARSTPRRSPRASASPASAAARILDQRVQRDRPVAERARAPHERHRSSLTDHATEASGAVGRRAARRSRADRTAR